MRLGNGESDLFFLRFAEINVRTYVSSGEKPGVWFFSLDATNPLVVWGARWAFYLPYFRAHIRHIHESGWTHYSVARIDRAALPANLKMYYRGMGNVFNAIQGTFEHFAYERYCLYTTNKDNHLIRCEIHHAPWPLQRSEAIIYFTSPKFSMCSFGNPNRSLAEAHGGPIYRLVWLWMLPAPGRDGR